MNKLKALEQLNNINFKLLVFSQLVYVLGLIGLVNAGFEFHQINIFSSIFILVQILMFIQDRKLLKAKLAYCPALAWFIIFPVYVYKRQNNNFLDLGYFYISVLSYVASIGVTAYIKNTVF